MANMEALKLPDPLLVRYYRDGRIESIAKVSEDGQRNITVGLADGLQESWQYLTDIGWIPNFSPRKDIVERGKRKRRG